MGGLIHGRGQEPQQECTTSQRSLLDNFSVRLISWNVNISSVVFSILYEVHTVIIFIPLFRDILCAVKCRVCGSCKGPR